MIRGRNIQLMAVVFAGGAFGALVRSVCVAWLSSFLAMPLWFALFIVNAAGSTLLGVLAGWLCTYPLQAARYWFIAPCIGTGCLGALTTFSGIAWEVFYTRAAPFTAFGVIGLHIVGCVAVAGLGYGLVCLGSRIYAKR